MDSALRKRVTYKFRTRFEQVPERARDARCGSRRDELAFASWLAGVHESSLNSQLPLPLTHRRGTEEN